MQLHELFSQLHSRHTRNAQSEQIEIDRPQGIQLPPPSTKTEINRILMFRPDHYTQSCWCMAFVSKPNDVNERIFGQKKNNDCRLKFTANTVKINK